MQGTMRAPADLLAFTVDTVMAQSLDCDCLCCVVRLEVIKGLADIHIPSQSV